MPFFVVCEGEKKPHLKNPGVPFSPSQRLIKKTGFFIHFTYPPSLCGSLLRTHRVLDNWGNPYHFSQAWLGSPPTKNNWPLLLKIVQCNHPFPRLPPLTLPFIPHRRVTITLRIITPPTRTTPQSTCVCSRPSLPCLAFLLPPPALYRTRSPSSVASMYTHSTPFALPPPSRPRALLLYIQDCVHPNLLPLFFLGEAADCVRLRRRRRRRRRVGAPPSSGSPLA